MNAAQSTINLNGGIRVMVSVLLAPDRIGNGAHLQSQNLHTKKCGRVISPRGRWLDRLVRPVILTDKSRNTVGLNPAQTDAVSSRTVNGPRIALPARQDNDCYMSYEV